MELSSKRVEIASEGVGLASEGVGLVRKGVEPAGVNRFTGGVSGWNVVAIQLCGKQHSL